MNVKQIVYSLVLADFLALTGYAVWSHGLFGLFELAVSSPGAVLFSVDLLLALTMALGWTWVDARRRGINPLPFVVVTALTGSAGPLAYLIRREWSTAEAPKLGVHSAASVNAR